MFNKTNYNKYLTTYESPSTIEVHEHKAPTDESIKYVEEVYNKVASSLIKDTKVEVNNVKAHTIIIPPMGNRNYEVISKMNVNNNEYTFHSNVNIHDIPKDFTNDVLSYLDLKENKNITWYLLLISALEQYTEITKDTSRITEFKNKYCK